jgi:hypothetical protein
MGSPTGDDNTSRDVAIVGPSLRTAQTDFAAADSVWRYHIRSWKLIGTHPREAPARRILKRKMQQQRLLQSRVRLYVE